MSPEHKKLTKAYIMKEIALFLSQNQDRFEKEITAQYGFNPNLDSIKEVINASSAPTHNTDTAAPASEDSSANAEKKV